MTLACVLLLQIPSMTKSDLHRGNPIQQVPKRHMTIALQLDCQASYLEAQQNIEKAISLSVFAVPRPLTVLLFYQSTQKHSINFDYVMLFYVIIVQHSLFNMVNSHYFFIGAKYGSHQEILGLTFTNKLFQHIFLCVFQNEAICSRLSLGAHMSWPFFPHGPFLICSTISKSSS